ncbi:MAG: DEAD/DEAH box helicase [Eggerthellaceae bacterium]|nr:DEAD/DEAH box helicase [Eggerthellaceae bacterium]
MGVALRPYQEQAVNAVRREWGEGNRATLIVAATGTGKTTIFGEIAKRCLAKGNKVLVLAHRKELIEQAASRLESMCGVAVGIEKAQSRWDGEPLCVGSVQTLQRERLEDFPLDEFPVIVVDEAHHVVSSTYRGIIDRHKEAGGFLLGVTATADRADRRGLAEVFDSIAFEYPMAKAVADGYLAPITAKCLPLKIDLQGVKVSHGDYQAGELGSALDPYLPEIARVMASECRGKKTVCFLPLVATSERMADELNAAGLRALPVSGYDADREERIAAFERGEYDVLTNALLLTEGWDCPAVDCIAMLRPTKSRSLYAQAVGRGTRLSPGKDRLLLLDFLWMTDKHDLARPASLLGKEPRETERMAEITEESEYEWGLEALAEQAERDVRAERERKLAEELARQRAKKKKLVDPLQFAASIQAEDFADYVPTKLWECGAVTDKQRELLERKGIDPTGCENAGQASVLIDALMRRDEVGLATAKQIRCLERAGFNHVGTWSREAASGMVGKLAACGWQTWKLRAQGIVPETYDPRKEDA